MRELLVCRGRHGRHSSSRVRQIVRNGGKNGLCTHKLHATQKSQLTTHTKIVQIPTTMAAADAPYEHLPMELRP